MNKVIDTVEKKNEMVIVLRDILSATQKHNEELKKENERLEKKYNILIKPHTLSYTRKRYKKHREKLKKWAARKPRTTMGPKVGSR